MKIKRVLGIIMTLTLVIGLVGCGSIDTKLKKKLEANLQIIELRDYDYGTISKEFSEDEYKELHEKCNKANEPTVLAIKSIYGDKHGQQIVDTIIKKIQEVKYTIDLESSEDDKVTFKVTSQAILIGDEFNKKLQEKVDEYVNNETNLAKTENEMMDEVTKMVIDSYKNAETKEVVNYLSYEKKDGQWKPSADFSMISEKIYMTNK